MRFYRLYCFFILGLSPLSLLGETAGSGDRSTKLTIGIKEAPPFSFKDEQGNWSGITVELWQAVAQDLGYDFEYRQYDLTGLLDAVAKGEVDIGMSALTVTAKRAERMDFTPTYFGTGMGIATAYHKKDLWVSLFQSLFTWTFVKAVFALFLVLLGAGFALWLFERKKNPEQFGGKTHHGLGNGFWWSAVTMTTVGYGDKAPVTVGGRLVGLIWMFTSVIIISGFTGALATALTVGQLEPNVKGPQDLPNVTVGVIANSAAEQFLEESGIHPKTYPNDRAGLQAVAEGKLQAFVNDHPILIFEAAKYFPSTIDVLPQTFDPGYIALALPLNSEHKRAVDLALLQYMQEPAWDAVVKKYLPKD